MISMIVAEEKGHEPRASPRWSWCFSFLLEISLNAHPDSRSQEHDRSPSSS